MLISVITPFKKGREYLADCLESLAMQSKREYNASEVASVSESLSMSEEELTNDEDTFFTDPQEGVNSYGVSYKTVPFRDFELILVLDHAEEDISDLVAGYSSKFPIRVVSLGDPSDNVLPEETLTGPDGVMASAATGVAAARNLGMESAEGDYFFFLDSDDYLFPRALSFIERSIRFGNEPDIIYGQKTISWIRLAKFSEVYTKHLTRVRLGEQAGNNSADTEQAENDEAGDNADDIGEGAEDSDQDNASEDDGALGAASGAEESEGGSEDSGADEDDADQKDTLLRARLTAEEYECYAKNKAGRLLISKRQGIRNVSALAIAYKRTLIAGNGIRFPEEQRYYADLEFISRAIDRALSFRKNYRCNYVKRRHDEQSSFPSIMDEVSGARFNQYVAAYTETRDKLDNNGITAWHLDGKLINYFADYYTKQMVTRKARHWKLERFDMMKDAICRIPAEHIGQLDRFKKNVTRALLAGNAEKVCGIRSRRDSQRRFVKKMKRSFAWLCGGKR